mmetsp:Transcript_3213/g.4893  ORF Transcript_3213/g.4893 Transcript_3213/m.4893 type:complete len:167 (-) Transcript_3213:15-515(-)
MGALTLQRAILADRLQRKKLAEKNYRKCVDEGSSLFGWWRLLEYYHKTEQPKATLVCLAEILDRAEEEGVIRWENGEVQQQPDANAKLKPSKTPSSTDRDEVRQHPQTRYGRYPAWIEKVCAQLVCKLGYSQVMKFAREVEVLDQKHLVVILGRVKSFYKSEGYNK